MSSNGKIKSPSRNVPSAGRVNEESERSVGGRWEGGSFKGETPHFKGC